MLKLVRTEDETMLANMARGFLDDAAPVSHLRAQRDAGSTHDPALWRKMVDLGWAGILIPAAAGGSDMGVSAAGVIAQEMGKSLTASPFLSTGVIAATALRTAGDRQRALKAIATGQTIYAVVDGLAADRLLVLARTANGLTLFDLAADCAGLTKTPHTMIDSRDAALVEFDKVQATSANVVGEIDQGMTVLQPALHAGQTALSAETLGLASTAMDMTVTYLKERSQFGVKLASFQALQHRAAQLWCEVEVSASTLLNAGRVLDEADEDPTLAVSLAKARATRTAKLAVSEAVQMHGGIGMTDEFDIGFYMKRARVAAEWLGDYGYHAEEIASIRGF